MGQVKAFMSETRHAKDWDMFPESQAAMAVAEARAILAVSEPTFDTMTGHYSQVSWQMLGASALATALAAFVGESKVSK